MDKLLLKKHLSKIYEKYPFMKDSGVYSPVSNELVAEEFYRTGYNKAVDEFAERLSFEISESIIWGMLSIDCKDTVSDEIFDYVIDTAKKIAEKMKTQ